MMVRWTALMMLAALSALLSGCGAAPAATPTAAPIQSAVAGDATRRAGPSGTATLNAINTQPQQVDAASTAPATGAATGAVTSGGQFDPCSLITKADVEAAIGAQVQNPLSVAPQDGVVACQFPATSSNAPAVSVAFYQGNSQIARQAMSGGTSVNGIGDAAASTPTGLYVRAGDRYFSVSVVIPGQQDTANAAARAIALKVLSGLAGAAPATG